jgi:hypothetical protein
LKVEGIASIVLPPTIMLCFGLVSFISTDALGDG